MTTVKLEMEIRKEAEKHDRRFADLDAKLAAALAAGKAKDVGKFKGKIADEADRHAAKVGKLQTRLDAAVANGGSEPEKAPEKVGVKDWIMDHWWVVLAAIPCIILINALQGCLRRM